MNNLPLSDQNQPSLVPNFDPTVPPPPIAATAQTIYAPNYSYQQSYAGYSAYSNYAYTNYVGTQLPPPPPPPLAANQNQSFGNSGAYYAQSFGYHQTNFYQDPSNPYTFQQNYYYDPNSYQNYSTAVVNSAISYKNSEPSTSQVVVSKDIQKNLKPKELTKYDYHSKSSKYNYNNKWTSSKYQYQADEKQKYYCNYNSYESKKIKCENLKDYKSETSSHRSSSPAKYDRSSRSSSRSKNFNNLHYKEKYKDKSCSPSISTKTMDEQNQDHIETEREKLLKHYRSQYCETSEEMKKKLEEFEASLEDKEIWIRSSPAELYYHRTNNGNEVESTQRLDSLCEMFTDKLIKRNVKIKSEQQPLKPEGRKRRTKICKHKSEKCSSSESSTDSDHEAEEDCSMEELKRKINHPYRLHPDLWHNEPGEMNDGPLCRCSAKSRRTGIRHGIYPGETGFEKCNPNSNNSDKLYHYRITISPPTNFLTKTPTMIKYDQHEFLFEGFSLLSHKPIGKLPSCKVIRFNIEYRILYIEEKMPEHFTIKELDLFFKYLFHEVLELIDFDVKPSQASEDKCSMFHFLPRFVRDLEDNGKEVLAMNEVLKYLLESSGPLVEPSVLENMMSMSQHEWQDYVDVVKGMVVTNPGFVPCSVRVDQLDRNVEDEVFPDENGIIHPVIVHFGIRPPQLSYAGNPEYQKARREFVRFRHLIANMSKPTFDDKRRLEEKENELQRMRTQGRMKRNITIAISSKGFYRTGIMCDIVQHAMLIPVLAGHLRFHQSLDHLEKNIDYKFKNRYLLQLALTHPSYKENFGTNPDHARNSLTNCGIRQPEYGDRKIHYMNTRKRGINTLINIMSRFGKEHETASNITHNERLEFLGDAVVEFLSSIHLFFMFPELEEGGLATFRAAIVQNQHLAVLAKKFSLDEYMLYAHGSDLCHELELRHAMANCFEALMGALLLDGSITVADKVFANALFMNEPIFLHVWNNYQAHPLQEQEPCGDRQWIESYPVLKELTKFEESIGIKFKHIRLLARAFTDRSIGYTHLTLGSNQRLEFLGDTVLQLICSEYLYRHFPEHHEGHLSLLRSSLVNNRTQAVVCDDLGMTKYAIYSNPRTELKTKDRADLLEAFLGALYVDKGLLYCQKFCQICLFPRLQMFIMNQDWNDPKSKLQQCCLTLRAMEGGEPDIPYYKVIQSIGPTNTRVYTVAVYFRDKRLATAEGHSIQQAEMQAAKRALENSKDLFPQLDHQKRVIVQSIKRQKGNDVSDDLAKDGNEKSTTTKRLTTKELSDDFGESHLPKQYRTIEYISSEEEFSTDNNDNSDTNTVLKDTKQSPRKSTIFHHYRSKRKRDYDDESSSDGDSSKSDDESNKSYDLNKSKDYFKTSSTTSTNKCLGKMKNYLKKLKHKKRKNDEKVINISKEFNTSSTSTSVNSSAIVNSIDLNVKLSDIESDDDYYEEEKQEDSVLFYNDRNSRHVKMRKPYKPVTAINS